MRLLTAIPLLFWTSTAAIAQFAVLWAAEPAAAVTHAPSQESALNSPCAEGETPVHPAPVHPVVAILTVPFCVEQTTTAQPVQAFPGGNPSIRSLAASLLLANPPPFGV